MNRRESLANFISLPQAADIAGVSPRTIIRMIEDGTIRGQKPRKHWRVDASSLKRHLSSSSVAVGTCKLDYDPLAN